MTFGFRLSSDAPYFRRACIVSSQGKQPLLLTMQDWINALRGLETLSNCLRESGLEAEVPRVTADFVNRHPGAEAALRKRGK